MTSPIDELFSRALGLEEPWQVVKIEFSESDQEINIYLDFPRGSRFRCSKCNRKDVPAYDTRGKRWRHLNFFQHRAYLHCPMPRVNCPDCGIKSVELPRARSGSGFTLLFETLIMTLAREMTVSALARLIDEHDSRMWRVIQHYVSEGELSSRRERAYMGR